MSVIAICGLPGSGKTLLLTYLMRKKFRKENNIFRRNFKRESCFNNVFTNYPIELKKKVFSNQISLYDLEDYRKWPMDSDIGIDEMQLYCDSIDFKNFPSKVRNFFQLHRHFGVNNIYVLSQDPSRIVKQVRGLIFEYYEITKFIKIPIIGIGIFRYNIFYKDEDYGKSVHVKKEEVQYRFKKRILFFKYKRVFKSYDTKYMRCLVDDKPYIKTIPFKDKSMDMGECESTFHFKEKEELERLEKEKKMERLQSRKKTSRASAPHGPEGNTVINDIHLELSNNEFVKGFEETKLALDQTNIANNVVPSKENDSFPFDVN